MQPPLDDRDMGIPSESPPPYQSQSPDPAFSQILTSTLEDIEKEISGNGGHQNSTNRDSIMQMLWAADLNKIQSLWKPNLLIVQNLKRGFDYTSKFLGPDAIYLLNNLSL